MAARVRQDISRARSSAVILAFMAGVAALLGAIVAWAAAISAGRYRDGREPIPYSWIGVLSFARGGRSNQFRTNDAKLGPSDYDFHWR